MRLNDKTTKSTTDTHKILKTNIVKVLKKPRVKISNT